MLILTSQVFAEGDVSDDDILNFEWDDTPKMLTDEQMENLKERSSGKFEIEDWDPLKRIDSKGKFKFEIGVGVTSDKFSLAKNASSTSIRVTSSLTGTGGSNRTQFAITLYSKKPNGLTWKSERLQKYSVGATQIRSWSNLPVGGTFYLHITTPKVASGGKYVKGTGSISNFGSVKNK